MTQVKNLGLFMVFLCFTKRLLGRRTRMFRIVQPLNNNVAVVKNESGEQAVVMGLGIIFKKKKGICWQKNE